MSNTIDDVGKQSIFYSNEIEFKNDLARSKFFKYGKALSSILKEKELSQKDFAIITGLSNSYVSEILSGKKMPDIDALESICGKINISIDVFFFKAINEEEIQNPEKKKMIRELKPLIDALSNSVYEQSIEN